MSATALHIDDEFVEALAGKMAKVLTPLVTDRLIRLDAKTCRNEGLELRALRGRVKAGELPVVVLGRGRYVRLSDLLALAHMRVQHQADVRSDASEVLAKRRLKKVP